MRLLQLLLSLLLLSLSWAQKEYVGVWKAGVPQSRREAKLSEGRSVHGFSAVRRKAATSRVFSVLVDDPEVWAKDNAGDLLGGVLEEVRPVYAWQTQPQQPGLDILDGFVNGNLNVTQPAAPSGGLHVFVVDTGIAPHTEFGLRLSSLSYCSLASATCNQRNPTYGDYDGHGTWCAGAIGGASTGVYPQATLHAVKVLDDTGAGTSATVLTGLEWVQNTVLASNWSTLPIVSMSVGGDYSALQNAFVEGMVANGIVVVVAAGNDGVDACTQSPASAPSAITVAAANVSLWSASRVLGSAYFTNWGACVDVYAPGVNVLSTWLNNQYAVSSGTSMATPYVAGAVAYLVARKPCLVASQVPALLATGGNVTASLPAKTTDVFLNLSVSVPTADGTACFASPPPPPPSPPPSPPTPPSPPSPPWGALVQSCALDDVVNRSCTLQLAAGVTYAMSECDAPGGCVGDTILALYDNTSRLLTSNDDYCSFCSRILYTVPSGYSRAGTFTLRMTCWSATSAASHCSGVVAVSVFNPLAPPSPPRPPSPPPPPRFAAAIAPARASLSFS